MIDHLQYNRTKFYPVADNSDKVTANGRSYTAVPKSFTIKRGADLDYGYLWNDTQVNCVAASDRYYYFTGTIDVSDTPGLDVSLTHRKIDFLEQRSSSTGRVAKTDVQNVIWGGKQLLAHVYHAVSRFLERRLAWH